MLFLLLFPLFVFACFFALFIPGSFILKFFKFNLQKTELLILPWFVGLSFFILINYLFAYINLPYLYLYILVILCIYYIYLLFKNPPNLKIDYKKLDYWSLLITILGTGAFFFVMFSSGLITNNGMQYLGVNGADGIRHIAYIKSMSIFFPPQHPDIAGVGLKGFHYFYDFLLSRFSIFFHFGVEDLYFRFFPLLLGFLYASGFYLLAKKITQNPLIPRITLFFIFFSRSFSFPLSLFFLI